MTKSQIAAIILLSTLIALMLSCGAALCHAEGVQERPNGLGAVIDHVDPNVSLVGSLVAGQAIEDNDGREGTVVRIHPLGMYSLFDEAITFCGDEKDKITKTGTNDLLVGNYAFTYRRAASRLINGVPCFALRSVYPIVEPRFKP